VHHFSVEPIHVTMVSQFHHSVQNTLSELDELHELDELDELDDSLVESAPSSPLDVTLTCEPG